MTSFVRKEDTRLAPCVAAPFPKHKKVVDPVVASAPLPFEEDEEVVKAIVAAITPFYSLESKLGDYYRADAIRRKALERITGKSLDGLPLVGLQLRFHLGQCWEMPVGYVWIPMGIVVPLFLDDKEYSVPMATTDGCLVASTNIGCKAILLKDGMTRAPILS
ncbi:hypothetical protein RJ640_002784 [Escallonia rubra]|uniref:Hydroxymethylglutaryl-CoA reductase (NADPH) n=1 Tax=Escallonia rubra TaxID=112253 RepID=A0AA88QGU1_9ASTE|nr:hypothetical protein RJ640_002784 [Escallonia rubra]